MLPRCASPTMSGSPRWRPMGTSRPSACSPRATRRGCCTVSRSVLRSDDDAARRRTERPAQGLPRAAGRPAARRAPAVAGADRPQRGALAGPRAARLRAPARGDRSAPAATHTSSWSWQGALGGARGRRRCAARAAAAPAAPARRGRLPYAAIALRARREERAARQAVSDARATLEADAAARDADCLEIRTILRGPDRRRQRSRRVRGHLKTCAPCRAWRPQRRQFLLAPFGFLVSAAEWLSTFVTAGGGTGAAAALRSTAVVAAVASGSIAVVAERPQPKPARAASAPPRVHARRRWSPPASPRGPAASTAGRPRHATGAGAPRASTVDRGASRGSAGGRPASTGDRDAARGDGNDDSRDRAGSRGTSGTARGRAATPLPTAPRSAKPSRSAATSAGRRSDALRSGAVVRRRSWPEWSVLPRRRPRPGDRHRAAQRGRDTGRCERNARRRPGPRVAVADRARPRRRYRHRFADWCDDIGRSPADGDTSAGEGA